MNRLRSVCALLVSPALAFVCASALSGCTIDCGQDRATIGDSLALTCEVGCESREGCTGVKTCRSQCATIVMTARQTGCEEEFQAFFYCEIDTQWTCDSNNVPNPINGCQEEADIVLDCLVQMSSYEV